MMEIREKPDDQWLVRCIASALAGDEGWGASNLPLFQDMAQRVIRELRRIGVTHSMPVMDRRPGESRGVVHHMQGVWIALQPEYEPPTWMQVNQGGD